MTKITFRNSMIKAYNLENNTTIKKFKELPAEYQELVNARWTSIENAQKTAETAETATAETAETATAETATAETATAETATAETAETETKSLYSCINYEDAKFKLKTMHLFNQLRKLDSTAVITVDWKKPKITVKRNNKLVLRVNVRKNSFYLRTYNDKKETITKNATFEQIQKAL